MKKMALVVCALLALCSGAVAGEDIFRDLKWGLGWDDGLTVRRWLGDWELGLAARPDDYLVKEEFWA